MSDIAGPLLITAISQVATNLADPLSVGAYAVGVGIGVLVGLVASDRITPGAVGVTIISAVPDVADGLWARGWRATVQAGHGAGGPVTVLFVAVDRRREARLHRDVSDLDPDAFFSTEDLRLRPARPPGSQTHTSVAVAHDGSPVPAYRRIRGGEPAEPP